MPLVLAVVVSTAGAHHRSRHFWFAPPASSDSNWARLTQLWHGAGNAALDWVSPSGETVVYLRGWGASPDGSATVRAYVTLSTDFQPSNCYTVWADVYDAASGAWEASVGYVHTWYPQFSGRHDLYFANYWHFNPGRGVSVMVGQDREGCPWQGTHVHETHAPNLAEIALNQCGTYCTTLGDYWNTEWANWTRAFAWD